jgi:hypothetical protein
VCNGENRKITRTAGACSASVTFDFASEAAAAATIIGGTAYPANLYPTPVPGGGKPNIPYFGFSLSSSTSSCTDCYWLNKRKVLCTEINGCTKATVTQSTATITLPPTTVTITASPSATADCAYWINAGDSYEFEVYNILGWAADGGDSLHHEEKGCGALTDWSFTAGSDTTRAKAYFYLPFFIKSGCVERAIVSGGGPKLQCSFEGHTFNKKRAQVAESAIFHIPSSGPSYSSFTTAPSYVPQSWAPGSVVTLTNTPVLESTTSYTTTVVIQNGTTVSFSGSPVPSSSKSRTTASLTSSGSTSS